MQISQEAKDIMKIFTKKIISDWTVFDVSWSVFFILLTLIVGFQSHNTIIEILSGIAGMLNVFLCAKGKVYNFYFGIFFNATYAFIALSQHYYASFILYLVYFLPMQFIGLYLWGRNRRKREDSNESIEMKRMSLKMKFIWALVCVLGVVSVAYILKKMGDPMPTSDSATNILTVIGIVMMVKRYAEQWHLWNISNVFGILLWLPFFSHQGNLPVSQLIMSIAFLVTSIYGTLYWMSHSKKNV